MQALDERLRQRIHSVVNDHVIHIYSPALEPDSIRLENIAGLVMRQAAPLDMV